jgi:hypothetical protein
MWFVTGCLLSNLRPTAEGPEADEREGCWGDRDIVAYTAPITKNIAGSDANATPAIEQAFLPATILMGRSATLVFAMTNVATTTISGLAFSDPSPQRSRSLIPPNAGNPCVGALSAPLGTSTLTLTGFSLAAKRGVAIHVPATSATAGSLTNTAGRASPTETGTDGLSNTATLTVERPSYLILLPMVRS